MADRKLNILCLGAFDSMDTVLAPCANELRARGHNITVVVNDKHDEINTKTYRNAGFEVRDVEEFRVAELDNIDAVIAAPTKLPTYRKVMNGIDKRSIPTFSFATLFSSVLMKMRADIVFTIGTDKFKEFEDNWLTYRCIAVGNPQYDALVKHRKKGSEPIRRVLVVDQGGYPYGAEGKTQLAETLVRIAESNPYMTFKIKPRYLKSERGVKVHRGSEYLSDYITKWPANLSEYDEPTVLEEIAPEYDAMITTWSTSFMDALVLNMPLLLISGLDSLDVFDVRTQRVNDAYKNLERTGCVYDYRELGDLTGKFKTAAKEYTDAAINHSDETCSDKIANVIEYYCDKVFSKGRILDKNLQITYEDFLADPDVFGSAEIDKDAQAFRNIAERRHNLYLQDCAYNNRCLGRVLDLSSLSAEEIDYGRFHNWDELTPEVDRWKKAYMDIKSKYFSSPEARETVENNIVMQDYYFEWLFETGRYEELEKYDGSMLAECSWNYYMACVYKDKNKKKAFSYLTKYLDAVEDCDVVQIERQRRIQRMTRPFIEDGVNKYRWYSYIYRNNKGKILDTFGQKDIRGIALYDLVRIRTANADGDPEKAIELYKLYDEKYQKRAKKKKKGLKSKLRASRERMMHRSIENEYIKAMKAVKTGEDRKDDI